MSGKRIRRWGLLTGLCLGLWPWYAIAQVEAPAADVAETAPAEPEWRQEVERLTGACLAIQAEQRTLRDEVRTAVADLNGWLSALNQAASVLTDPEPEPAAAVEVVAQIALLDTEEAQIERWLWGEELPTEPGVTRESLRARLGALRLERRNAQVLAEAHGLEGAFDREQMRGRVIEEAERVRGLVESATRPLRQRLAALDARAAEESESFEKSMTAFGRISGDGPVAVEAVRADGWFQHGLVSFRWSDRRGRLVATAQVRLRPSVDRDLPPPLLHDRFAVVAQAEQEATVSVGYFSVVFRVAVPELSGEQEVLDALSRLLDLEKLGAVRPARYSPTQN